MLLRDQPKPEQLENLKTLQFSAESLLSLINDILDYSKIEAGKVSFENTEFNFREFIYQIEQSFRYKAEETGVDFSVSIDENIPEVLVGDPGRLNQILTNLLSNAFKFTSEGGVFGRVSLERIQKDNYFIKFEIKDTGIGIPSDKQTVIFERFTQASADVSRKFGGTGLGLAITKNLLELQNSKIELESWEGVGSTFYFTLCLKKA
ncbi:MAG: hypothetical protein HC880_17405, partial [Bacteroidia bacterium]|nr:hypothetical protein [Bacteroidia bacterium]